MSKSDLDLVFSNGDGKVESLANIINRGLVSAQLAADVTGPIVGRKVLAEARQGR